MSNEKYIGLDVHQATISDAIHPILDNQVAAPAVTRTPNWHRANSNRSLKSADGRTAADSAKQKLLL